LTQSNNFSHADWAAFASGTGSSAPILTANYTTSPFGTNDAWRFQSTVGTSGYSLLQQSPFISGQHTASLWVKSNTSSNQSVYFRASTNTTPVTVTPTWTRISVTEPNGDYLTIGLRDLAGQSNVSVDISIYAGQLEDGAYPTSIIPSTTAAVTRVADAASKTGISSLIGQSEGTLYWEGFLPQVSEAGPSNSSNILNSARNVNVNTGFSIQHISGSNSINVVFFLGDGTFIPKVSLVAGSLPSGTYAKIAFGYKSGSSVLYVNGTLAQSSSVTFTSTTTMSELYWNDLNVYFGYPCNPSFNETLLFTTRLTNAQLAELTTL
jgi:hypothetical protein